MGKGRSNYLLSKKGRKERANKNKLSASASTSSRKHARSRQELVKTVQKLSEDIEPVELKTGRRKERHSQNETEAGFIKGPS